MTSHPITLSTRHHPSLPSVESGQVAPVESVESRVQKILSEIFGNDLTKVILAYHQLKTITTPSSHIMPNQYFGATLSLTYAKVSNEVLEQFYPNSELMKKIGRSVGKIILDDSEFDSLDLSEFKRLKWLSASGCDWNSGIDFEKLPESVIMCEADRCDASTFLPKLPVTLRGISLRESEFNREELSRFVKLYYLSLSTICGIDFSQFKELGELILVHDGTGASDVNFSELFKQLSKQELSSLCLDGYSLKGIDFCGLPSSTETVSLKNANLKEADLTCFPLNVEKLVLERCPFNKDSLTPLNVGYLVLERCPLNKDSLTQLPKNLKQIYLINCTIISSSIDLCQFPKNVNKIEFKTCNFEEKSLPPLSQDVEKISFVDCDLTEIDHFQLPEGGKYLMFSQCTFGRRGLSLVSKHLDTLYVIMCNLKNVDLSPILRPNSLKVLSFTGCDFSNLDLSLSSKNLKELSFCDCHFANGVFYLCSDNLEEIWFKRFNFADGGRFLFPKNLKKCTFTECNFTNVDHSLPFQNIESTFFENCDFTEIDVFSLIKKTRTLCFCQCKFSGQSFSQSPKGIQKMTFIQCQLNSLDVSQFSQQIKIEEKECTRDE